MRHRVRASPPSVEAERRAQERDEHLKVHGAGGAQSEHASRRVVDDQRPYETSDGGCEDGQEEGARARRVAHTVQHHGQPPCSSDGEGLERRKTSAHACPRTLVDKVNAKRELHKDECGAGKPADIRT